MKRHREPLFCYCLTVGAREFAIQVMHDGVIHWDDYQQRGRSHGTDKHSDEGIVLMTEPDEYTVSFDLDPELLAHFRTAAAMLEAATWNTKDECALDEKLLPLFWERVNPQLPHPLTAPNGTAS
ncbi:MAG: hypothetical protein WCN98_04615 [Verrucomicrobiaceae bacterium]